MSGHSKWHNIQHKKGLADAKRGKMFTKIIKELSVAVRKGGSDVNSNPRLRLAMLNARGANMPKDTVERAINKAAGAGGESYEETTFEAYGPSGEALFIECATDNNTRTVSNLRSYFNKYGGNIGKDGCLQFIFDHKGVFNINSEKVSDVDQLTLDLIDVGAEDVETVDNLIVITSSKESFGSVQKKLQELNVEAQEAGLQRVPNSLKTLDQHGYAKFMKLLEILEDDDDIQKVYHNVEYDEKLMQAK
jgi:YebC/PmpR family DNA-binding regulatory protein